MKLISQNYGKQKIRVLKVLRENGRHTLKEVDFGVRLEGDFESSYTSGDNSGVIPTDTMKNTVHALANEHLENQTEPFVLTLAAHFLTRYAHLHRVTVDASEQQWQRMVIDGAAHAHSFTGDGVRPLVHLTTDRNGCQELESGLTGLRILKSTNSGFSGFPRCAWTTLPETDDRILATSLDARWRWHGTPLDYPAANAAILAAMLRVFATNFSPSVQTTLYEMAGAAFAVCPEIDRIHLSLPNSHYLPVDLTPFGLDGRGVSFLPSEAPHGLIEATLSRS